MTSDHYRELRVLRGPQAGSRLSLSAGDYLMGSSDECTIILSGPRMQPVHMLLQMGDDTIHLLAQDGAACDTQGTEIEEEREIELGEPFELGGIWITIDEPDAPWPDEEDIAALGAAPAAAAAEPQPSKDEQEEQEPAPAAAPEADTTAEASGAQEAAAVPTAKRLALPLSVTAIAAAAMVFALRFALADTGTELAQNTAAAAPAEAASAPAPATPITVLQQLGERAGRLVATQTEAGVWRVSGYVPTAQERNTIVAALSELQPPPEMDIHADEELLTAAGEVLAARPYGTAAKLRIEGSEAGKLKLAGAARDPSLVDGAALALIKGVPGAHAVESGVLLPEELIAQLRNRLAEASLQGTLDLVAEASEVLLSGTPNDAEVARWEQVRNAFRREYADALVLKTAFTRKVVKLPFEVKTIVGGPAPYIVTSTGEHVARGGRIAGLTLSSVGDTQVVFDGNQRLMLAR